MILLIFLFPKNTVSGTLNHFTIKHFANFDAEYIRDAKSQFE